MPTRVKGPLFIIRLILVVAFLGVSAASAVAGFIDAGNKYAWSEYAGWLNLRPSHGGVTVAADHLSGYAWHENIGWLKLGADTGGPYLNTTPTNWGVNRDAAGRLSGYAWSEGRGWINFNPTGGGVTIDPVTEVFDGYAWGENIGWLKLGADAGGPYLNTTPTNWGVNRDAAGRLSGYAWSEGRGWINYSPSGGGVRIDPVTGVFDGYAWGENIGWLSFGGLPGGAASYGVGLTSYPLHLVFDGTGSGAVSCASPAFSCNTNCTRTLLAGTPVTLTAAASRYCLSNGWQGCDTRGGADCNLLPDQERSAFVTFNKDTAHLVRIDGPTPVYFPTLQAAYDKADSGGVIQAWGLDLGEALVCGNGVRVIIAGGYDQQYLNRIDTTTLHSIIVRSGTVTVERILVK